MDENAFGLTTNIVTQVKLIIQIQYTLIKLKL